MVFMDPIAWLVENTPDFGELSPQERDAIMHFALLWSRFEADTLNAGGNAQAILAVAERWREEGLLVGQEFAPELAYFRDRYFKDGKIRDRFGHLQFRHNDHGELVERVMRNEAPERFEVAAAVLIIVYRLRNNYFHGVKWAYGMRGQLENFTHANNALMQAIALHDRSLAGR